MIIITRADGGVSILHPTDPRSDVSALIAKWESAGGNRKAISWRRGRKSDIPTDRTFRNAWDDSDSTPKVVVNMPKAREIHMDKIRATRDAKLAELDIEVLKAMEAGDTARVTAIAKEKQDLRNIPQTFDLSKAKDPESLKKLWPDI